MDRNALAVMLAGSSMCAERSALIDDVGGLSVHSATMDTRALPLTPSPTSIDGGRPASAVKARAAKPPSTLNDVVGQAARVETAADMPATSPLIESIREAHRQRQDLHRAEKSLTLQCKAICRRLSGGDKKAGVLLFDEASDCTTHEIHNLLAPYLQARDIFNKRRKDKEKQLEQLAKALPAAEYIKSVKGLGFGSLAALVGECGDLANYSTHSKLWKRMGLAPYNGKAPSTWRMLSGKRERASADDWKAMGYSPARRSISWNIGQCVLKAQSQRIDKETGEIKTPPGFYRQLFDARKEYEKTKPDTTPMIVNCRALRYMEKRILRDIWRQWNALPAGYTDCPLPEKALAAVV